MMTSSREPNQTTLQIPAFLKLYGIDPARLQNDGVDVCLKKNECYPEAKY